MLRLEFEGWPLGGREPSVAVSGEWCVLYRDSRAGLTLIGHQPLAYVRLVQSTIAMTFTSTAMGVGNALISIVVRVGLGLPLFGGPAKYSAYTAL